jgi:hypothetical protein
MSIEKEREIVRRLCEANYGKLWPNGLGFDAFGWSYLRHPDGTWSAVRRFAGETRAFGVGDSPIAAKHNAKPTDAERRFARVNVGTDYKFGRQS